nr:MAG TPA: hypothetical protein [Caudoviricetes sp.]
MKCILLRNRKRYEKRNVDFFRYFGLYFGFNSG